MTYLAWRMASALACVLIAAPAVRAESLDPIGGYDPGTPGLNATAVGLDGFAYLGSWGGSGNCPALGVRIFDVRDPTAPTLIGTAGVYSGTTAEHLTAVRYATGSFVGNVLFA